MGLPALQHAHGRAQGSYPAHDHPPQLWSASILHPSILLHVVLWEDSGDNRCFFVVSYESGSELTLRHCITQRWLVLNMWPTPCCTVQLMNVISVVFLVQNPHDIAEPKHAMLWAVLTP